MFTLSPGTPVRQLVAERPVHARILEELGIDLDGSGHRTLQQVCTQQGLDPQSVLKTLLAAEADPAALSLSELCDHIVGTHHAFLGAELDRLGDLCQRVASLHGDAHSWLRLWKAAFEELADRLRTHLLKEEVMLFPAIRHLEAGRVADAPFGSHLQAPLDLLEREHEMIGRALVRLRDLYSGLTAPGDTCPACKALLDGLAELERDLQQHIRKERDILFPRALAQFGPVGT